MDQAFIPYGRQHIDEEDIAAVVAALRSDWLTTGPEVERFEASVAKVTSMKHAVAVCNGTAALHTAMFAIGIGPGDEVIVPTMTFAATANAVLFQQGIPVFADVCENTLLIDPQKVEERITPRTRAIVAVDYAGQPCDYAALQSLANHYGLVLMADACHSLGGAQANLPCGALADLSVFSFHPVKPITTAEGGMIVTNRADFAERMRRFRNHGIETDHRKRMSNGQWHYEMTDLGFNYRLSDLHCALGLSQLAKLSEWTVRRQQLASAYDVCFANHPGIRPLVKTPDVSHAYHLYVVRVPKRDIVFSRMRNAGIGVNVHYVPVHLHPYYRHRFGTGYGTCPVAEAAYNEILSLPIYPDLTGDQLQRTVETLRFALTDGKGAGS